MTNRDIFSFAELFSTCDSPGELANSYISKLLDISDVQRLAYDIRLRGIGHSTDQLQVFKELNPFDRWQSCVIDGGHRPSALILNMGHEKRIDLVQQQIKRSMLISNTKFIVDPISHNTLNRHPLAHDEDWISHWDTWHTTIYLEQHLEALEATLRSLRPAIETGEVVYIPQLSMQTAMENNDNGQYRASPISHVLLDQQVEFFLKNPGIGQIKFDKPALQLDLPMIDGTSLTDFVQIKNDLQYEFSRFQDHLDEKLQGIQRDASEDDFRKVERELREGVREVSDELRRHNKKAAFNAAGAIVGGCTAALYHLSVPAEIISSVTSLIAGGGALAVGGKTLRDIALERYELSNKPCYFLWVLEEKMRNKS